MEWLSASLKWYLYLLIIGLVFFPFIRKYFSSFIDQGYAFSKTVGILILSYLTFLFGTAHILPFARLNLILLLGIFLIASIIFIWKRPILKLSKNPRLLGII